MLPFTVSISIDSECYTLKTSFDNPSFGVYLDLGTLGASSSQVRMKLSSLCELPALHHKGPRFYLVLQQIFSPSFSILCHPQRLLAPQLCGATIPSEVRNCEKIQNKRIHIVFSF